MFSHEICEIFKNTYFEEHHPTTASVQNVMVAAVLNLETLGEGGQINPLKVQPDIQPDITMFKKTISPIFYIELNTIHISSRETKNQK